MTRHHLFLCFAAHDLLVAACSGGGTKKVSSDSVAVVGDDSI
jgi:hypothetical protein